MKRLLAACCLAASTLVPIVAIAADSRPVLIVVGLKDEADRAQSDGVVILVSASNQAQLRARLNEYDRTKVRAVISFGIAGGLAPDIQAGDLALPTLIVNERGKYAPDAKLLAYLKEGADQAGLKYRSGIEAATDDLSDSSPAGRAAIRQTTGGDAVDMESGIAAEFAKDNGLPFAAVRVAGDPYDFQLPPAATIPLLPDGTPNRPAIDESIRQNPGQLGDLMRLNGYYQDAMRTLESAGKAMGFGSQPASAFLPFRAPMSRI